MAELDIEKLKSCTAIKQIPILTLDERMVSSYNG